MTIHLLSNQCRDEAETWCEAPPHGGDDSSSVDPRAADCVACLERAAVYGLKVEQRLLTIGWVGTVAGFEVSADARGVTIRDINRDDGALSPGAAADLGRLVVLAADRAQRAAKERDR